jgi:hypothetical protein
VGTTVGIYQVTSLSNAAEPFDEFLKRIQQNQMFQRKLYIPKYIQQVVVV